MSNISIILIGIIEYIERYIVKIITITNNILLRYRGKISSRWIMMKTFSSDIHDSKAVVTHDNESQ